MKSEGKEKEVWERQRARINRRRASEVDSSGKLCSIWDLFTDSWNWQSFVYLIMFLFPLDLPNEIQLLSGFFCYSWLVCLLGCGWEMRRLEIIVFKNKPLLVSLLRLAGCARRLKSLKRFLSIYIAFDICLFFSGSWSRALSILKIELKCEFFREFLLKAHCYIPRLSLN